MAYKLKTEIGKAVYRLRKSTVEPVIGIIKEVLGFRQFSLRGLAAAAGEWCLVCLAFNLKRLHVLLAGQLQKPLGVLTICPKHCRWVAESLMRLEKAQIEAQVGV